MVQLSTRQSVIGMPNQEASVTRVAGDANASATTTAAGLPRATIFTLPKPFTGDANQIQRNAIGSWAILGSDIEVILIGDECGIAETADQLGVGHLPGVEKNELGTPLISSAFSSAAAHAKSDILIYCNADVILDRSFIDSVMAVVNDPTVGGSFLAIGRRTDVAVESLIDWSQAEALPTYFANFRQYGKPASIVCKEYFAFRRNDFQDVPAFAVGRGNWDNWMVASAKQRNIPVVNLSQTTSVFHQEHHYRHLPPADASNSDSGKGRLHCYVTGDEAQENQRLAGGKNLISGSTSTWRLTDSGVVKNRFSFLNLEFWTDFGRFAALVRQLFFSGRS